jgi:signal transduction histidine kinase
VLKGTFVFKRIPIRSKLAFALALPLVIVNVVASLEVYQSSQEASQARQQSSLATAALGPKGLIRTLQNERTFQSLSVIGLGSSVKLTVTSLTQARGETDTATTELKAFVGARGSAVKASYVGAFDALNGIGAIRADADSYHGPQTLISVGEANTIFGRYSDVINALLDPPSHLSLAISDPTLRGAAELLDAGARSNEDQSRATRAVLLATLTSSPAALLQEADQQTAAADVWRTRMTLLATPAVAGQFPSDLVPLLRGYVSALTAGGTVPAATIAASLSPTTADGKPEATLADIEAPVLAARASAIQTKASSRERLFVALAVFGFAISVIIALIASRSIARPLRRLAAQADDMAATRLPQTVEEILNTPMGEDIRVPDVPPISIKTRDEVADVADALNNVQTSALNLAVEQSVLRRNIADAFVNLGRRNQNLIGRQLDFITELESRETDPDALDNLFRLDHLATRMRRHAESLLVLAGVEPTRQWSNPVSVRDVVRASLSEVEGYQRVQLRLNRPAAISGAAVSDVAHLLAELIENALVFSPPEAQVEVHGRPQVDGYAIAIVDSGIGMKADQLIRSNARLDGSESFTVAPSRYLGHYVAGHLSRRMGAKVWLADSPVGGVVARVLIPSALIEVVVGTSATEPESTTEYSSAALGEVVPAVALPSGTSASGRESSNDDANEHESEPSFTSVSANGSAAQVAEDVTPLPRVSASTDTRHAVAAPVAPVRPAPAPAAAPVPAPVAAGQVAAPVAAGPPAAPVEAPAPSLTASGLTRRIRAAQSTEPAEPLRLDRRAPSGATAPGLEEPPPTNPDVLDFLAGFGKGPSTTEATPSTSEVQK